jgi:hypothetical protein
MYRLAIVSRGANNGRLIHTTVGVQSAHGDLWLGPERAAGREHVGYGAGNWVRLCLLLTMNVFNVTGVHGPP